MNAQLKLGWKCVRCQNCGTLRFEFDERFGLALERLRSAHVDESDGTCASITPLRFWFISAARRPAPVGAADHG